MPLDFIFAHTDNTDEGYPSYVNISATEEGRIVITTRNPATSDGAGPVVGATAQHVLPKELSAPLCDALVKFVGTEKHTGLTFGAALTALKEGYRMPLGWEGDKPSTADVLRSAIHFAVTYHDEHGDGGIAWLRAWEEGNADAMAELDRYMAGEEGEYEKDKECQGNCGACECGHRAETEAEESLRP